MVLACVHKRLETTLVQCIEGKGRNEDFGALFRNSRTFVEQDFEFPPSKQQGMWGQKTHTVAMRNSFRGEKALKILNEIAKRNILSFGASYDLE